MAVSESKQPLELGQRQQLFHAGVGHLGLREIQNLELPSCAMSSRPASDYFGVGEVQVCRLVNGRRWTMPLSVIGSVVSTREVIDFRPAR